MSSPNEIRDQATKKRIDWNEDHNDWSNWRVFVGPNVRAVWHTLSDDQKVAIAKDAYEAAMRHEDDQLAKLKDYY